MHYRTKPFIIVFFVVLAGLFSFGYVLEAQQVNNSYSYVDKLFGKRFSFTPKPDEIMIRFAPGSKRENVKALTQSFQLEEIHDAVAEFRFGVYQIKGRQKLSSMIPLLKAQSDIKDLVPVMVDQEGYIRYFMPDEFTVKFSKDLSKSEMKAIISSFDCDIVKEQWTYGYYTLAVPEGKDPFEMVRTFMALPEVVFSELSFIGFDDHCFDPDDTFYPQQWPLHNTGSTGGSPDADIDAREAWDIEAGIADVLVVIIDTGVDYGHQDLYQNIAQNLGEDADGDGHTLEFIGGDWVLDPGDLDDDDDDGNGLNDDLIGWDFYFDDNDPYPSNAHGTSCAGIAAAVTNNTEGVAGIAHNCRVMPLRINLWSGMNQNRADAINYAATFTSQYSGVVLSCSWGASGDITAIHDAMVNAKNEGAVICFASGNDNATPISYPARYPECIAVGATSECDERKSKSPTTSCDGEYWWGSNYGDELDISGPGVHIYTTDIRALSGYTAGDYIDYFNGTSAATPHVAGAAALLLSYDSTIDPDKVQDLLERSADKVGGYDYNHDPIKPGHSLELGYGRLNVNRALQFLIAESAVEALPTPTDLAVCIDRSGSMIDAKLNATKNAAAQIVRLMDVGDELGVTTFSTTAAHLFPADPSMVSIASETDKDDAIAAIETITRDWLTTIGGGLEISQDKLDSTSSPDYPQAIILMSDGMQTASPWVADVLPTIPGSTDVYTIGFGTIGENIDEATLQDIATTTGGTYYYAGIEGLSMTSITEGTQQYETGVFPLIKAYQASHNLAAGREIINLFSERMLEKEFEHPIPVDDSLNEIRFSLLTDRLYGAPPIQAFYLITPSGKVIDPAEANVTPLVDYIEDVTLRSYTVRQPETGTWKVKGSTQTEDYHIAASGYSDLKSIISVKNWGINIPLLIQVRVIQNGLPVKFASVNARVRLPHGEYTQVTLFDDGSHRDEARQDGIYANIFSQTQRPGSYAFETTVNGTTINQNEFRRHNVTSVYLSEDPDFAKINLSLPHLLAPGATITDIPLHMNTDLTGRGIVRFNGSFTFDPSVVAPTGGYDLSGTMLNENWNVTVSVEGSNEIEVSIFGAGGLQGSGILVNLPFKVIGKDDESSKLAFEYAEFGTSTSVIETQTTSGSLTVGNVFSLVEACEGDFDLDADVDGSDLAVFAADFGRTDCKSDCEGDFDKDGDVDGSDLAVFAADFGRTDCP